ncbi:TPA: hypothetical protein DEB00_02020 [Candidatus Uhrbacteria bacterium]|nr:hypothetical protein [Candidatus Uhrbacteria bacterium]
MQTSQQAVRQDEDSNDWEKARHEARQYVGWLEMRLINGRVQYEAVEELVATGVRREVAGWALVHVIQDNGGRPPEPI